MYSLYVKFEQLLTFTHIEINHYLVTTLKEMWKTKTHTFNLLLGQETTTLKDVAVQLDLPIDGEPVSGVINGD